MSEVSLSIKQISALLLVAVLAFLLFLPGCSKDENPINGGGETVPPNLFPLVQGRVFLYSGYLTQLSTETKIQGSDLTSSWTLAGNFPLGIQPYPNPFLILDSTNIPGFAISGLARQFFIDADTATGEYQFLSNLGFLFRSQGIYVTPGDSSSGVRPDSLVWINLLKTSSGVGSKWIAYNNTFTARIGPLRLEIEGEIEAKENLTLAGTTFETYRLVATRKIYLGAGTTPISTGVTAKLWVTAGIGPVRIWLYGDDESNGKFMDLTGKNF
jgi:hypothetical protein